MGQHRTNPVAQAAKRGELGSRPRDPKTGGGTRRPVLDIVIGGKRQYWEVACKGGVRIERRYPKVRGKATVKATKKARQQWRKQHAKTATRAAA